MSMTLLKGSDVSICMPGLFNALQFSADSFIVSPTL